jgi:hypothetical protein
MQIQRKVCRNTRTDMPKTQRPRRAGGGGAELAARVTTSYSASVKSWYSGRVSSKTGPEWLCEQFRMSWLRSCVGAGVRVSVSQVSHAVLKRPSRLVPSSVGEMRTTPFRYM